MQVGGRVENMEGTGSMGTGAGSTEGLPLRLSFVMSAYNTAQRMIRFSGERASFVFLFFGIILSILGIRGDRVLLILGGRAQTGGFRALFILLFVSFLVMMSLFLLYGLQTIIPRPTPPPGNANHRRLYWCRDVLRYPAEEYLAYPPALSDEAVLQEMAHELYASVLIERKKFDRIDRCLHWAAASFSAWVARILMTIIS